MDEILDHMLLKEVDSTDLIPDRWQGSSTPYIAGYRVINQNDSEVRLNGMKYYE